MGQRPAKLSALENGVIDKLMTRFEASGLTWDQLAEKSGVPRTTAFKTLNKQRASTINEIMALSDALGLVVWKVVREVEESLRPSASITDLSALRSRLESGEYGDAAALDPKYPPADEQDPHTP